MTDTSKKAVEILAQDLVDNADLDAAEGGNMDVCNMEWKAAKTLRALSDEIEILRAENARLQRKNETWARSMGEIVAQVPLPDVIKAGTIGGLVEYLKGCTDRAKSAEAEIETLREDLAEAEKNDVDAVVRKAVSVALNAAAAAITERARRASVSAELAKRDERPAADIYAWECVTKHLDSGAEKILHLHKNEIVRSVMEDDA